MTLRQLAFKADPENRVVILTPNDLIREGDYVEWTPGAWTNIVKGSALIGGIADGVAFAAGNTSAGMFARIVPREAEAK